MNEHDALIDGVLKLMGATITEADIAAIESLSDAAIRSGHTQIAIEGYALALRLRSETGLHPKRRAGDHD